MSYELFFLCSVVMGLKISCTTNEKSPNSRIASMMKVTSGSDCGGCGATIIVDKLSVLLSLGVPADAVVVFARYLQSLAEKTGDRFDVVLLTRRDPDDVDGALNRVSSCLTRSSDLTIRCWPLGSGKSGSVTGNLSFEYSGGGCETGRFQFSVEDKTVRVFALGASKDVL